MAQRYSFKRDEALFGAEADGMDLKVFGATSGAYFMWDASADKVIFDKADLAFGDTDYLYFGDANDVSLNWNGTNFVLLPVADDTGIFQIGDGTTDFDVRIYLSTTAKYVDFNVGDVLLKLEDVDLHLGDNDALEFGDAATGDVRMLWNASALVITPAVDDTGAINIGDGTTDIDFKWFAGTANKYVDFNVGDVLLKLEDVDLHLGDNDALEFGDAATGDVRIVWNASNLVITPAVDSTGEVNIGNGTTDMNFKVFLGDASNYVLFDVTNQRLDIQGTGMKFQLGTFASSAAGSGTALSSTNTGAFRVYADDAGLAITSDQFVRGGVFRTLLNYAGTQECEAAGVIGQMVASTITVNHNTAGTWGSWEAVGTTTVTGTSGDNIHAGVLGRVGAGAAVTLTVDTNGVLAGVAAMSNINSSSTATYTGVYAGMYVGGWATTDNFVYGLYMETGAVTNAIKFSATATGIDSTVTALGAAAIGNSFYVTVAAPNNALGTAGYFDTTVTGTVAGHTYGMGSWINLASGATLATGGAIMAAQDNGFYDGGGTLTNGLVCYGLRMEYIASSVASGGVFPFMTNTNNQIITALFSMADNGPSIGFESGAGNPATAGFVPLAKRNDGSFLYVKVHTATS